MTDRLNEAFETTQVVVGATPTLLAAGRIGADDITIENLGTTQVFIGNANVSPTTGFPIPGVAGASLTIPVTTDVFGIVASGTQPVAVLRTF